MICAKTRAVTFRTIKIPPESAAEFSQLAHSTQRPRRQSAHQGHMVAHINYARKRPRNTSNFLKLLVLGLFGPFDKIKISIDRRQKCRVNWVKRDT